MSGFTDTYRPSTWEDFVGNDNAIATLQNEVARENKKQTYLFTGETGIGKTTFARLLASYLLSRDGKPVDTKTSPDYLEFNVGDTSGVDFIRELAETVRFRPSIAPYRIFVLDEVQALSVQARNALLKNLEEPPKHVIFILCSMEGGAIHKALKTRCMNFDLDTPDTDEVAKYLKRIAKKEKILWFNSKLGKKIAEASDSSIRRAVTILEELALNPKLVGKKITDSSKLDKYINKAIDTATGDNEKTCANLLAAIYKGLPSDAYEHACNLTGSELSSVLKLMYQNKYLIDRVLIPSHPKTAHWGLNKQLSNTVGKVSVDKVVHVQTELMELRAHYATVAVPVGLLIPIRAYNLAKFIKGS